MRLSHIQARLEQQVALADFISNSFSNLTSIGLEILSQIRIQLRIDTLKEEWEKFKLVHDSLEISILELSNEDRDLVKDHSYFVENLFPLTHEKYLDSLEKMMALVDTSQRTLSTRSNETPASSHTMAYQQVRLPRIDLPKFNGTQAEWLSFKDLFHSLVLANLSLTPVEKLQYLKTSLVGKAAHLLKHTTLTGNNFEKAWDSLISFYENKRLLVNTALQSLLDLKRMTSESAIELEKLYTDVMQTYRTLETLQRPVSTWDDFLVFLVVQRLDSETVKAWEHTLGASKEPPMWGQLTEFLVTRLRSLQAFEKTRPGKCKVDHSSHAFKSHFQGRFKDTGFTCPICKAKHHLSTCSRYHSKTLQQRLEFIKLRKLCYNCLGPHRVSTCRTTKRCGKCGRRHHTSIHKNEYSKKNTNSNDSSKRNDSADTSRKNVEPPATPSLSVLHSSRRSTLLTPCVLLGTAKVMVTSSNGMTSITRALIDPGSEISLITERLTQRLRMDRSNTSVPLIGIGAQASNRTRGMVAIKVKPHFDSNFECSMTAHVLPKLTNSLPSAKPSNVHWPHLHGLHLADPTFLTPGSIDLILGADVYGLFIEDEQIKGTADSPMAQASQLGWIVSGPTGLQGSSRKEVSHSFQVSIKEDLHHLIKKFWEVEKVPTTNDLSKSTEDSACEEFYQNTISRDVHGRYTVRLPFKQPVGILGNSKKKALRILLTQWDRFLTNESYSRLYSDFIAEYEQLRHMVPVSDSLPEPEQAYYLPHHGVLKEDRISTKLRVVFNGSSPTTSGLSLNDLLYTGEKLQADLFNVLIWFRQYCYVFSTDIEKMFRQVNVHQEDWKYQRILWKNQKGDIVTYELNTVTYGLVCAPFLALRTLAQLVKDEGKNFPLAVSTLSHGRYVDDLFGGADDIVQAQRIVHQVNQLCMAGGFPLRKWASNHIEVLNPIPEDNRLSSSLLKIEDNTLIHSLGLSWNPSADIFQFDWNIPSMKNITKRTVLSTIAMFFDPLGLLSPIIIKAKIFVQELWSINLGWDDPLPSSSLNKWIEFTDSFQDTHLLKFPRWLGFKTTQSFELHGFCDASRQAIAAVVYIRSTFENGEVFTQLICSKTKVAPLKRLTIPRLELSGAVLLSKLVSHVLRVLQSDHVPIYLWTDSSITYTWINNHPSRWQDFVHNRVCFIQETVPQASWRFVPGIENPADFATRGLTPKQLSEHSTWWTGPHWLLLSEEVWPHEIHAVPHQTNLEERAVNVSVGIRPKEPWDLLLRYSSLTKLIRITVICQRVLSRLKRIPNSSLATPVSTEELKKAQIFWIKTIQSLTFKSELSILSTDNSLPKSNPLAKLTPFLDTYGILRVGGRLQASHLSSSAKHPAILPKDSPFSILIIQDAHLKMLHGGTQVTLSYIRNEFWILGGRTTVRSHIFKCVRCTRFRQKRAQQLMGQLPPEKLSPSRAFQHTGIDYAGPFSLKTWRGKNARTYKAYIALFVCYATSAVHIELVTDYTADTFIAAFKRFTSRRGICSTLMSDCGTTLKGADAELRRLFSSNSEEIGHLATLLAKDGTQWKFNPPSAPHFGGKWEAGVKSVKYHMKRVIGDALLTYEEMSTLLTQVEAVLNSRPLCPLTEDPDDLDVLTPGHFIMGCAPSTIPEPSLQEVRTTRLSRWQMVRQMLECFWTRWSTECLQRYLSIYKWNQVMPSLKVGSLVLVVDERYPPSKWPLGRVIKTHPGKDDLVRVVTVRTHVSELTRPIVKLCPLPIAEDTL